MSILASHCVVVHEASVTREADLSGGGIFHQQRVSDVFQLATDSKRLSLRIVTEHRDTWAAAHYDIRLSHSKSVVENLQVEARNQSSYHTPLTAFEQVSQFNLSTGYRP